MARQNIAQLNGYTSGGKTGTAQKIDVLTHRYSKTKYIASFVGIAPVNNPAISVAVIIDSPQGNHYGNVNAAPVFREVAQDVLEYLGVPHDTNLTTQTDLAKRSQSQRWKMRRQNIPAISMRSLRRSTTCPPMTRFAAQERPTAGAFSGERSGIRPGAAPGCAQTALAGFAHRLQFQCMS